MNKRGFFLAEETMKIILAVICLGFLLFVLGKMYYSYTLDKEVQQAKDTLARVEKEINSMKGDDERKIVIYGPVLKEKLINFLKQVDWWMLVSFSSGDKPKFCTEKEWNNCLCICKNSLFEGVPVAGKSTKEKCDETDLCVYFSGKTLSPKSIDLKSLPITIPVTQSGNAISF